ncbi:hydroxyacid oxidase 2 [Trichonephila clavipes]|uniref:Hydroxyacid oxidase 2 n=1 Tax=Trichonephila clavipes TaxID=2585209 RepID=A0A8X6SUD9_TRICX|nr:hydroxyacid oxidase 2 [Trichonephila clavipes]
MVSDAPGYCLQAPLELGLRQKGSCAGPLHSPIREDWGGKEARPKLEALPEIVRAVKGRAEVYLDGGVRRGGDVFKALALGAKAVFFGRPAIWGLVHSGQGGVENVLKIVKSQLDTTMALTGVSRLEDIQRSHVVKGDPYEPPPLEMTKK